MILTTCDIVEGQQVQILGLVQGNVVQTKHIGKDLMAGLRSVAGGEIKGYTEMLQEGRAIAEQRMVAMAESLGADAIVCVRFSSASVMEGALDMLAYGTAVKFI